MDERRLTRGEWEAVEEQEYAEVKAQAKEQGSFWYSLHINGPNYDRQPSWENVEALLDAQLADARAIVLHHLKEKRDAKAILENEPGAGDERLEEGLRRRSEGSETQAHGGEDGHASAGVVHPGREA
jgi:hypothetical protein